MRQKHSQILHFVGPVSEPSNWCVATEHVRKSRKMSIRPWETNKCEERWERKRWGREWWEGTVSLKDWVVSSLQEEEVTIAREIRGSAPQDCDVIEGGRAERQRAVICDQSSLPGPHKKPFLELSREGGTPKLFRLVLPFS